MLASSSVTVKPVSFSNQRLSLHALWKNSSPIRGGASGATTLRVNNSAFVKIDPRRTAQEVRGQRTLRRLLPRHTAPFWEADTAAGLVYMPLLAYDLDTAVKKSKLPRRTLVRLYDDFLQQMTQLWVSSRSRHAPSPAPLLNRLQAKTAALTRRYPATFAGLSHGFAALAQIELEVNGVRLPSLNDLKVRAETILTDNGAPVSVTAHRDEHAKNIMIRPTGQHGHPQWLLVDYPDVQENSDWVWSIVKMRAWWQSGSAIDSLKQTAANPKASGAVTIQQAGNLIKINTDLQSLTPSLCSILDQRVQQTAVSVAQQFGDPGWQQRYRAMMFHFNYCLLAHYGSQPQIAALLMAEAASAFA